MIFSQLAINHTLSWDISYVVVFVAEYWIVEFSSSPHPPCFLFQNLDGRWKEDILCHKYYKEKKTLMKETWGMTFPCQVDLHSSSEVSTI